MAETVIIGGGLVGLAAAQLLGCDSGPLLGLEKEARLGGRAGFGDQRLYDSDARDWLSTLLPGLQWQNVDEAAVQARKGDIGEPGEDLNTTESYYTGHPCFRPLPGWAEVSRVLSEQNGSVFHIRQTAVRVDMENRQIECQNGQRVLYSKLVWTANLASFIKASGQTPNGLGKGQVPTEPTGGLTWDTELVEPLFPHKNTLILPFRFKDLRLKALGTNQPAPQGSARCHWIVFLEDSLLENREELAKIVRALKREVGKQFPTLATNLVRERLAMHSQIVGDRPVSARSLEVFPGVVCVGDGIRMENLGPGQDTQPTRWNLDQTLRNCLDFQDLILPQWQKGAPLRAVERVGTTATRAPEPSAPG